MPYTLDSAKSRTLAVFSGPHWVHEKFASVVAGHTYKVPTRAAKKQFAPIKAINLALSSLSLPGNYDFYFTETGYYYASIAKRLGKIKRDSKIINLVGSPLFYNIHKGIIGKTEGKILLNLLKEVNGMVIEGKYTSEILTALGISIPTALSYTYIKPERYARLLKIEPSLGTFNVCIIATNDIRYKGLDILCKAIKLAAEEEPKIRLKVVHGGIDIGKLKAILPTNATLETDAELALSQSSLYVHPARGDVFPIAPQEAMLAGVPAMVSNETGTKEFVGEVEKRFVLPLDEKIIAKSILSHFQRKESEKKELSCAFRKIAMQFNEQEQLKNLKENYEGLLKRV